MSKVINAARTVLGILLALVSAFFLFYTARLLYVTRGLTAIRSGGQGAYVGAIVFPILALVSAWGAWRYLRFRT
jgi:membrane protein implicated in regulation of membrane protease activity